MAEKKVLTEAKDYTLSTLKELSDDGIIITDPDYQRDFIYSKKQSSKLIESILMGIPIPTVYLCQEKNEYLSVIDGQQRITSFVKYLKNEFPLEQLDELPDLSGKKYKELDKSVQAKLKNSSLHAIIIQKESEELKYEIFARLNQGAIKLTAQELRNCIYRGKFNQMLNELARNKLLPGLFLGDNKRKSYQELILRFFALRNYTEYKSSMLKTMNAYMSKNRDISDEDKEQNCKLFNNTIDTVKQVLGESAFRDTRTSKKFSGSVYDSIMIPFSFFEKTELIRFSDKIRDKLEDLKQNDEEYKEDTYAGTGSRKRVIGRINKVHDIIRGIIDVSSTSGICRLFSKDVKEELFRQSDICSYCKNKILSIEDAEVDHKIPFSKGGSTDISNAQLLHRSCNRQKGNSIDDNFEDEEL